MKVTTNTMSGCFGFRTCLLDLQAKFLVKELPLQTNKLHICKVEFIQPSNWLYSVPNLIVIQHLVTLYLGGFDVRVVSEIE